MTIDGTTPEIREMRDISVLLDMNSYQDMTDAEIESIIEYKTQYGILKAVNESIRMENAAVNALILEQNQKAVEESKKHLDDFMKRKLILREV